MLTENLRPSTITGVKRLASQFKKSKGIKYAAALDLASNAANCENYRHAQRTLPVGGNSNSKPYVLLTRYWYNKDSRPSVGRETLRVQLSVPIFELCAKNTLKYARGFGDLRLVADDHFVCDDVDPNQEYARNRLCKAERSLRFMEHTGLIPNRDQRKYPQLLIKDKLPNTDHPTSWIDHESGQFVLIDEPYGGAPDEEERSAWASRNGWKVEKSSWPGMYYPYQCDIYVCADITSGYDVEALVAKIDAMPAPVTSNDWAGESVHSWDTFVSPMAKTKQDKRRARCKGTIYPETSKTTEPFSYRMGCTHRHPIGALGVDEHVECGRIIKAAMSSEYMTSGAWSRLNSLRSELESWYDFEIKGKDPEGIDFFKVYYGETPEDKALRKSMKSAADVVFALGGVSQKLKSTYPDCAPLRQQLRRLEMAASMIGKAR